MVQNLGFGLLQVAEQADPHLLKRSFLAQSENNYFCKFKQIFINSHLMETYF